jgi:4,5-DOPA dioxygenase extradiol
MTDSVSDEKTPQMPVLFIGHGSPMNAITENSFTKTLNRMGHDLSRPRAILCISAHWMTEGTWITGQERPKTIHDFYGFPQELFDVQYPSPGDPESAREIQALISEPRINIDLEMWGIDHGSWSVLRHLYPKADIPVMQLSLYLEQPAEYHLKLGQKLRQLRKRGILIIGSGNIVHNLRRIRWESAAKPYDWAIEFDEWIKAKILERDFNAIANDFHTSEAGKLSVPTLEHYLPLLYVLGASDEIDNIKFEYEEIQNGSISMRTLGFY